MKRDWELFEQLKKMSMKSVKKRLLASIVILIILLAVFGSSFYKLIKGPEALYSLPVNELPNAYVEGDINVMVDIFAEYYEENDDGSEDILKNYYIIPIGEEEYFALEVKQNDFDIANQVYDETYEYLIGERDALTTSMKVTGTVKKMNDDTYDYYMDWFETSGFAEEPAAESIESIALPYVLQMDYVGNFDYFIVYIALGVSGIVLLYAVIILTKGLSGAYISPIKKYIKDNENILSIERLESDYENAVPVENIRAGEGWTYFFRGSKARIIKNTDIIWAYLEEVTHKTNGIKTGVTKSLILYTKDKKKHSISMKSSSGVNSVLDVYSQTQPHIVIGFSEDLKNCFNKDFDTFVRLPYRKETAASSQNVNETL